MENKGKVRVRFAPSPSGYTHICNLRAAVINYLFAKHNNGAVILRIEDTDRTKNVGWSAEEYIEVLKWVGLEFDEGPYYQSKRIDIYKNYVAQLLEQGHAYRCFCTEERLEKLRRELTKNKKPLLYDGACRSITKAESDKLARERPFCIRMRIPKGEISFRDIIIGEYKVDSAMLNDQIIQKADGMPTYYIPNAADDHLMGITHIIRGNEWLLATAKQIILNKYLGWEPPKFAHLPLVKINYKIDANKGRDRFAVESYKKLGYLPEAVFAYAAFLGWVPNGKKRAMRKEEMIKEFSIERCCRDNPTLNLEELKKLNEEYKKI